MILALFTVIPGTVSQKVYAEPGGSESSQAADASKDDSNKKEEKKEEDMTTEEREKKAEEDIEKLVKNPSTGVIDIDSRRKCV